MINMVARITPRYAPQLFGTECLAEFLAQYQIIDIKIHTKCDHEQRHENLQVRCVAGKAVIPNSETSGTCRPNEMQNESNTGMPQTIRIMISATVIRV